jgi:hypothetical protein
MTLLKPFQAMKNNFFLILVFSVFSFPLFANTVDTIRMRSTNAKNMGEIIDHLTKDLTPTVRRSFNFNTPDPYHPKSIDARLGGYGNQGMLNGFRNYQNDTSVCGLKFVDALKVDYHLKTFPSKEQAQQAGFIVTHTHPCGACSSLKDLAIYLDQTDLTAPARECSKKFYIGQTKKCLRDKIGFTLEWRTHQKTVPRNMYQGLRTYKFDRKSISSFGY